MENSKPRGEHEVVPECYVYTRQNYNENAHLKDSPEVIPGMLGWGGKLLRHEHYSAGHKEPGTCIFWKFWSTCPESKRCGFESHW